MTTPQYLITHCTINSALTGAMLLKAGTLISDPTIQAAVASAGGTLGSASDPLLITAAANVVKQRTVRGSDEFLLDTVMLGAMAASAAALKFQATIAGNLASGTTSLGLAIRPGTLNGGTIEFEGTPSGAESQVIQVRKNGANITGATVTYNTSSPSKILTIPNLAGVTYNAGDEFDFTNTYTIGGGGLAASFATALLIGQP
jgi:hypothetical protein